MVRNGFPVPSRTGELSHLRYVGDNEYGSIVPQGHGHHYGHADKMTTSLSQILGSPAKTDSVKATESLLSNEWWKDLKDSLHPQEGGTPMIFWIRGAAWTVIDNFLSDGKTEHDFGSLVVSSVLPAVDGSLPSSST
jgi:hypothetical protein